MSGLTAARLRIGLAVFFAALALPAAVLVATAYDRLKWEAFHQYRGLAEELAARIDARSTGLVHAEEARSFADYGFLVVAGDASASFVQRSPLAAYPVDGALPGLIGYFQVDSAGVLSTPLLPRDAADAARYGVPPAERAARAALAARIHAILGENRLVTTRGDRAGAARREPVPGADAERAAHGEPPMAKQSAEMEGASVVNEALSASLRAAEPAPAADALGAAAPARAQAAEAARADLRDAGRGAAPAPQAAFDELKRAKAAPARSAVPQAGNLGRVEDLKLDAPFAAREARQAAAPAAPPAVAEVPAARVRATRKEQTAVPAAAAHADKDDAPRIRTFESELDPFEASLLDSGHLVLFRKVWRGGQRFIQGALLDRARFVEGLIESAFRGTALAQMSNLALAWQGDVFAAYGAASAQRYLSSTRELDGALLYRTRLSAPLADLELVFTVTRLPEGPGAQVIAWTAVALALVLCGGTLLMYRLGARQIALARQQQDFVSAVSHELRTPLTSIRMYAEMLREGWATEDKRRGYYAYIHDESERLSRLIANVLQLARMSRNEMEVNPVRVSAGELMDQVRSKVSSQAERAGFALDIACGEADAAARVRVDPDAFSQVIINLVDNALKFSARADCKAIEIACRADGEGRVVFSVRDHGPGIARDQMRKIFGLFYRGGNELTRETAGTGIGLALVRRLCEAMGGRVDVENAHPGARFSVSFPAAG